MKALAGWRRHAPALAVLLLLPFVFFWEMTVGGEEPLAADTQAARALGEWAEQARDQQGETPLWCPMIFSGMPSYGSFIHTPSSPFDVTSRIRHLFPDSRGMRYYATLALGALAMYLLFTLRRKTPLVAATATLLYVMTPYFLGLVAAGHSTKLQALYLAPLVFLAIEVLLARRTLAAAALLAVAVALQLWNNHPQISYYTLLLGGLYAALRVLLERPAGWRRRGLLWGAGLALLALVLAGGLVMEPYGGVLEYTPHSIRGGGGELAEGESSGGVGWDYATAWSYPLSEILCFVFPGWFGLQSPTYWGTLSFTQSTHYVGLIALLLAWIGWRRTAGRGRWAPLILIGVILLIGFGRNLPLLFWPMYEFLPMFSRFRVPSMIYALLPFFVALLAAEGLQSLIAPDPPAAAKPRAAGKGRSAAGASWWNWRLGGVALFVVWLFVGGPLGESLAAGGAFAREGERLTAALRAERIAIWKESIAFALLWIALAGVILELRRRRRIAPALAGALLAATLLADLYVVDRRFYDPRPRAETEAQLQPDGVVRFLRQAEPPLRVAPLTRGDFGSNRFAAFGIETIGGYHPAKLRIYNDLLQSGALYSPQVLSMLNVHYIVSEQSLAAQGLELLEQTTDAAGNPAFIHANPFVLPRAWFVREARTARDARELIERIGSAQFDPATTAWFYADEAGVLPQRLSAGEILIEDEQGRPTRFRGHDPEHFILPVRVAGPEPGLLVMSEIFYEPGWEVRLDGSSEGPETLRLLRANHVLRALLVPPGEHEIEILAVSPGLTRGRRLSQAAAGALALMLLASGFDAWRRRRDQRAAPASAGPA